MTDEQTNELRDILQDVLDISSALKVMIDIADQDNSGLSILIRWAHKKAANTGNRLDEFLMKEDGK